MAVPRFGHLDTWVDSINYSQFQLGLEQVTKTKYEEKKLAIRLLGATLRASQACRSFLLEIYPLQLFLIF